MTKNGQESTIVFAFGNFLETLMVIIPLVAILVFNWWLVWNSTGGHHVVPLVVVMIYLLAVHFDLSSGRPF